MAPPNRKPRRNSVLVRRGSVQHCGTMKEVELGREFELTKQLGAGRFGTVHLATDKRTSSRIALKLFHKSTMKQTDFIREYNYSFFLSPHQNIIDTYEGTFSCTDAFFFVQEFTDRGSLRNLVENSTGTLPELVVKEIIAQVISALEFMHNEKLVWRGLKPDNVLLFGAAYDRVKITDFGMTRKEGTLVKHFDAIHAYHAPELCETLQKEAYSVEKSVDVWALGITIYYALRGRLPWQKASIMCKAYWEWEEWLKRKNPQLPKRYVRFTEKALKLFKKSLNPKDKERGTVKELKKYFKDKWLKETKCASEEDFADAVEENRGRSMSRSLASVAVTSDVRQQGKRRSVIHHWLANTLSAMSEISEQMVSATED